MMNLMKEGKKSHENTNSNRVPILKVRYIHQEVVTHVVEILKNSGQARPILRMKDRFRKEKMLMTTGTETDHLEN